MKISQSIKQVFRIFIDNVGKKKFILIIFFGFIASSISISEPFFFSQIISYVEDYYRTGEFNFSDISLLAILWASLIVVTLISSYIYRYYLVDLSILKNENKLFKKKAMDIMHMTYGSYLDKKQGTLYKKFDRGITDMRNFLFFFFLDIVKSLSGVLLIVSILFFVNFYMTLALLSMLPLLFYMGFYFNSGTLEKQKSISEKWQQAFGLIGDSFSNFSLIKVFNLENKFSKMVSDLHDESLIDQYPVSKRWSIGDVYTGVLVMLSRFFVLILGIYLLTRGELSLANLFLFFSFIGWVYFPLSFIFSKLRNLQEWLTSIYIFTEEFDNLEDDKDKGEELICKKGAIKGKIEFKGVSFAYNEDEKVLDSINIKIEPGERIALVGTTGAGKSTIINLIFRLWEVTEGGIYIDGKNINKISKKCLRDHIGIVLQDNTLFNMSILENMKLVKDGLSEEEIENALKKAQADFVWELKKGWDTVIGERGLKLSGGEKQRLSIARIILKNPEILILDEATSALDNETEREVQSHLDELMKGKTSIIVAHRLTTVKKVDKIFVIERGQIVEEGTYEELIKKGGKFHNLANPDKLVI